MNTIKSICLSLLCIAAFSLSSCEEENGTPVALPKNLNGVFIVNEGAFGQGNGTISFISSDSNYFAQDLYMTVNNLPLGDVVQSMNIFRNKGYIAVNNSQKLVVVNMVDFNKVASITINSPRYFVGITGDKGYVSDWSDNSIKKINLDNNTIAGSIPCGNGPEQMVQAGEKLFVCNSGGFTIDSTVTVVHIPSDSVLTTITTGVNPSSCVVDAGNRLWILCTGTLGPDFTPGTADDIGGKLLQMDVSTYAVIKSFDFPQGEHPVKLQLDANKQTLFFLGGSSSYTGAVYKMNIGDNVLPSTPIIAGDFYGLGIQPSNGDIYVGLPSFSSNTYIYHYSAGTTLLDSTLTGIGPNGFKFN